MAKVYVAASYLRKGEAAALAAYLHAAGHYVTSVWHEEQTDAFFLGADGYTMPDSVMERMAMLDAAGVRASDTVVCITGDPPDRKSHGAKDSELGGAIFTGRRAIILGGRSQVFHWHRGVRQVRTKEQLLEVLA